MRLRKITLWLIFLFPIFIVSVKGIGPIIYVLLAFIGIYIIVTQKVNPFKVAPLRLFSWLTLGYFLVMVLSVFLSNEPTNGWIHLSRKSQFLLAPLVGIVLYTMKPPLENLLLGTKIGAIVAGMIVLTEYLSGGYGMRLSGMLNANVFADNVTIVTLLSISNIAQEKPKVYRVSLFAVSFGALAVALSGSRGSILSFFLLVSAYLFFIYRYRGNLRQKKKSALAAVLGMCVLVVTSLTMGSILHRVDAASEQVGAWEKGTNKTSSVSVRLEMYTSGLKAFLDAPLIGYGYRNANVVAARYASPEAKQAISGYTHLHNEFITNMVSAGIIGLIALCALFFLPLRLSIKALSRRKFYKYGLMGFFLILGYMALGMTHGMLEWEHKNSLFLLYLGFVMMHLHSMDEVAESRSKE